MSTRKQVYGNITVDDVKPSTVKENRSEAQLRQEVEQIYPGGQVSNNLHNNLFQTEEFNFEPQKFTENRVCWIDVPNGTTKENVMARLAANPKARLKKILSHEPILHNNHISAIDSGITTIEEIAERQLVTYPEDHDTMPDEPIMYNQKKQYKLVVLSLAGEEDEDRRQAQEIETPVKQEDKVAQPVEVEA